MGHPTAIFLSEPDPNYKCPICLDVCDDPVSLLKCGHLFCRSCLDSSLSMSGRNCPQCRAAMDVGDDDEEDDDFFGSREGNGNVVHPVRAIRSAIDNLTVRCMSCLGDDGELLPDDDGTCKWTGPLSRWPLHSSTSCSLALATCPIPGCGYQSSRSMVKSHVGSTSCVKAAVASKVEEQVNGCLGELRRQMKREVERKTGEVEQRVQEEMEELEERVRKEMEGRLVAEEVNRVLKRENKGLKRQVMSLHLQRRHLQSEDQQEEAAATLSASSQLQEVEEPTRSKKKKKKRGRRAPDAVAASGGALVSPSSSSLDETESSTNDEGEASGRKRRKKSKKRRHGARGDDEGESRNRMRSVSTDSM